MVVLYGVPSDLSSWMRLVGTVSAGFPGLETEELLAEHAKTVLKFMHDRRALCVKDEDRIIGVLLFSRNHNMICCLAVDPARRREGIATALLEKALSELDRSRDITVSTFREDDPKGLAPRALYKKLRFVEDALTYEFGCPNQVFLLRPDSAEKPVIELRPRTPENVVIFFQRSQDEEIRSLLPMKAKSEDEALEDYEKALLPGATSYGKCIYYNGTYVGDIWAYCIGGDPDAMLSFCIFHKALRGRGIAAEAVRLFLCELKEMFSLHTLGAFAYSHNEASARVLRKNGFREIETFVEDGIRSVYYEAELPEVK